MSTQKTIKQLVLARIAKNQNIKQEVPKLFTFTNWKSFLKAER